MMITISDKLRRDLEFALGERLGRDVYWHVSEEVLAWNLAVMTAQDLIEWRFNGTCYRTYQNGTKILWKSPDGWRLASSDRNYESTIMTPLLVRCVEKQAERLGRGVERNYGDETCVPRLERP